MLSRSYGRARMKYNGPNCGLVCIERLQRQTSAVSIWLSLRRRVRGTRRTMPGYFMLDGVRMEAKIKLNIGEDCNVTAGIGFEKMRGGPLFEKSHVAPTDPKAQAAEALQYALDALVLERPPDALAFCEGKLREYDEKFVR